MLGIAGLAGAAWWWQNQAAPAGAVQPAASGSGANPAAAQRTAAGGPAGPAGAAGPVSVEVGKVEAATLEDDATAVGSLRSRQGVVLRPEVSGRIASLGFSDGQRVRRGQLLVQLDDTLQQAQLKQAEAQASIARTNLQRNRELVAENFVSQSAVDQSAAALEVAEAQVALTKAQLARMRIVAPFDGMAGIRSVDLGDYVKDGADLVNIEDLSQVLVDFRLPERFIARVKTGQTVDVSLDALPGQRFTGRIDALDSVIDADGRSLLVRARLDNPGGVLKSGLFARTRIVFRAARERAGRARGGTGAAGWQAVPLQGGRWPERQGRQAHRGASSGCGLPGKVEVLEGLAAGDLVVTAGQARLGRGDAVPLRVVDLSNPAGTAAGRPPGNGNRPASGASAPRSPSP